MDSTRIDRWLWAVRLSKTRADAATACRGGHVRVNDKPAKASTPVRSGDTVRTRLYDIPRVVEVGRVIEKRVGAPEAVTCYVDHTPPPPPKGEIPPVPRRERGAGRPTKRDRRRIEAFERASLLHGVEHDLAVEPDAVEADLED
ncbi:RNA-binding S4 domain-containing protein [Actinomycetospora endophytica]|uniref:RNA-binding S4 domain-containing protein n=1 Tax=Actinomycetospora endophytica TaxID=2291215 RepID=A0ABS8PDQ5_9PSEU|nr:RNA-binding S4 domain-containing protein [Actinomycetospora endophytica]MCD2196410.1 RNA-binding S4 domain-containing protein [Actinomycetospora endophytica]